MFGFFKKKKSVEDTKEFKTFKKFLVELRKELVDNVDKRLRKLEEDYKNEFGDK